MRPRRRRGGVAGLARRAARRQVTRHGAPQVLAAGRAETGLAHDRHRGGLFEPFHHGRHDLHHGLRPRATRTLRARHERRPQVEDHGGARVRQGPRRRALHARGGRWQRLCRFRQGNHRLLQSRERAEAVDEEHAGFRWPHAPLGIRRVRPHLQEPGHRDTGRQLVHRGARQDDGQESLGEFRLLGSGALWLVHRRHARERPHDHRRHGRRPHRRQREGPSSPTDSCSGPTGTARGASVSGFPCEAER